MQRRISLPRDHVGRIRAEEGSAFVISWDLFSSSMAAHIVSWGGSDHITSPDVSRTSSIVSIDSILPHKRTTAVQGAPAPESLAKRMSSLPVEPSGSETLISASTYERADSTDDSFIRHHKYFFKDGNVTFLVRGSHP
jgi:hypothetical protein